MEATVAQLAQTRQERAHVETEGVDDRGRLHGLHHQLY